MNESALGARTTAAPDTERWTIAGVVPVIALVIVAGLALRLILAFVVYPQSGSWSAIRMLTDWSMTLADVSPARFYGTVDLAGQPPGSLVVLWVLGVAGKTVAALTGGAMAEVVPVWIKLPAILADIAMAWVVYAALRRWHGPLRGERWGVIAAAAYLFVPMTWYDAALWGQVDAFGVLVGGLALVWLIDRRPELAAGAAVAAALVEPRLAIIVLPVVALVLLRRHLRRPDAGTAWTRDPDGPIRLLSSLVAAAVVLVVLTVPFDLETLAPADLAGTPVVGDLAGLASLLSGTAGGSDVLTANAYNPWALMGPMPLATTIGGDLRWTVDSSPFLGIPAAVIGLVLFLAVALGVAVLLWRRQDRDAILVGAITLGTAFFVLPTRGQERFLFVAAALSVLLLPRSRGWRAWFLAATSLAVVNMHAVLTLPFRDHGTPELRALPGADLARDPWVVVAVALGSVALLGWSLLESARLASRPAPIAEAAPPMPATAPFSAAPGTDPTPDAGAGGQTAVVPPPIAPSPRPRPLFPGRLRPRDLGVAILIALALSAVRLAGLERPLGWYSDEDLHGRTATELLQGWRYGRPHELEGWTDPLLARELMAASIEALGGHEVDRILTLDAPVVDAALEPAGATLVDGVPSPSLLFVTTGTELLARALTGSGSTLHLDLPGIRQLAYEPTDRALWVAAEDGSIARLDAAQLVPGASPADSSLITSVASFPGPADGLWAFPGGGAAVLVDDTLSLVGPEGEIATMPAPGLADVDLVTAGPEPRLALTLPDGIHLVSVPDLAPVARVSSERRPLAATVVDGGAELNEARDLLPEPRLYVVTRGGLDVVGGLAADTPAVVASIAMPGPVTDVAWNPSTNLVHVLGREDGRPTVYVVEPHGNAVFADAELPAEPIAWGLDARRDPAGADRQRAVLVAADGSVAEVGLGGTAFAARLPGALLGGLAGAFVWLLLALLVRRRVAATIGLVLVATELLLFGQSRIATPAIVTVAGLLAAWLLLAAVLRPADLRAHRARWLVGLPMVGALLGLAASASWTGAFGLGGVLLFLVVLATWQRLPRTRAAMRAVPAPWTVVGWGVVSIPLIAGAVYVAVHVPWAFLAAGDPQLFAGWPKGHAGELFLDLQQRMLAFQVGSQGSHPAGSPWWSWPLMLKPAWAYLEGFGDMVRSIVLPANPVVAWLSLPAVAWAVWRLLRAGLHPGLLLLVVAFAAQWLPWAGVGRAAFFHDHAAAMPFALALLALLLARLWAGASMRTWRAMRSLAVAIAFLPAVLWALSGPICSAVAVDPTAGACDPGWESPVPLVAALGVVALVLTVAAVTLRLLDRWDRRDPADPDARGRFGAQLVAGVAIVLGVTFVAVVIARTGILEAWVITLRSPTSAAVVAGLAGLPIAYLAATARSPRRFVTGVLVAAVTLAVLLYPAVAGLQTPITLALLSQALLPTAQADVWFRAMAPSDALTAVALVVLPMAGITLGAWALIRAHDRRIEPGG